VDNTAPSKVTLSLPTDFFQELDAGRMALAAELRTHLSTNQYLIRLLRLGLEQSQAAAP